MSWTYKKQQRSSNFEMLESGRIQDLVHLNGRIAAETMCEMLAVASDLLVFRHKVKMNLGKD